MSMVVGAAVAAPTYFDGYGKEWRQVTDTVGLAWSDVAAVCATDGATQCAGTAGGVSLDGWIWADIEQIGALFNTFGDHPGGISIVNVPQSSSRADDFIDTAFDETYSDNIFRWVAGWSSTLTPGGSVWVAEVIDKYPTDPNPDIWTTADNFGPGTHPSVGHWLWRSASAVPEPSSALLAMAALCAACMARRRT